MTQDVKTGLILPAAENMVLGKTVEYASQYAPELLQSVPRKISRDQIGLNDATLPFSGEDTWTGYELSWLNPKGKPVVAILECRVPVTSPNLIESKSFKLYLNSFNQTKFDSTESVCAHLTKDLSKCAGADVAVEVHTSSRFGQFKIIELAGTVIDDIDINVDTYSPSPELLTARGDDVSETLVSHLLKSNCLITNQPDWASVMIRYRGKQIDHAGLLKYLISFREHNEFHEQCVERIFCDINTRCKPEQLTVLARYTRRGGLDINPFRSNFEQPYPNHRLARQ